MQEITLEQLAYDRGAIYLDNSVLNQDLNLCLVRQTPYFRRGVSVPSIAERLGAAKSFHDVKQSILNRQLRFSSKLNETIGSYETVRSSVVVVGEYLALIDHLERALDFLVARSCKRKRGIKEATLRELTEHHQSSYNLLLPRSIPVPGDESLARYLENNRLHFSPDNYFVKRNLLQDTSRGDSQLVSQAIMDSLISRKPVSIISADFDIVNLVRNYGLRSYRQELPAILDGKDRGLVTVYFPAESFWIPSLGLQLMCNTAGEQEVYGVPGRYF